MNHPHTDADTGATVLVVDDEPVICMIATNCLQDAGFRTLEARNAGEAIDLLESGEHVDVVFSDVQMPGMDGFELQRWIRQHHPKVKVLLASGVDSVKAGASGQLGAPRWLVCKPYSLPDLVQRVRDLLRS